MQNAQTGPMASLKKGVPKETASFASTNIHPSMEVTTYARKIHEAQHAILTPICNSCENIEFNLKIDISYWTECCLAKLFM